MSTNGRVSKSRGRTLSWKLSKKPSVCVATSLPFDGASIPLKVMSGGRVQTVARRVSRGFCGSKQGTKTALTEEGCDNANDDNDGEQEAAHANAAATPRFATAGERAGVLVLPPHAEAFLPRDLSLCSQLK